MSPELLHAVKERLDLGYSHDAIKDELRTAGYTEEVLDEVLHYATGEAGPIPIPNPSGSGSLLLPNISTLISDSFRYATSRVDFVLLLAVPYILFLILNHFAGDNTALVIGAGLLALVAFIAYLVGMAMLLYTVAQTDRQVSMSESFAWAKTGVWGLLLVYLLSVLVTMGGFMLFIIPGVIISVYIYFSQYVYMMEGKRGFAALLRSRDLVLGHWWDVALKLLGVSLVLVGIFFLFGVVLGVATFSLEEGTFEFVVELVTQVFSAFATVMSFHIGSTLYRSLAAHKPVPADNYMAAKSSYLLVIVVGLVFAGLMSIVAVSQFDEIVDAVENGEVEGMSDADSAEAKQRAAELRDQ